MVPVAFGDAIWGDYDGDGDLDVALQGVVNSFRTSRGRLSLEEGTFTITGIQGVATGTEADALPDRPCHFEEAERPKIIRLHFVREEILAT